MLSTVFSWRPFSSFSLWIILLPSDSRCFLLFGQTVFFLRCLRLRLAFVQSLFLLNLGRQSWRDVRPCVWPWGLLNWVFRLTLHDSEVRQRFVCGVFARRNDCGFAFTCLAVKQLSNLAVKRSTSLVAVKRFTSLEAKRSSSLAVNLELTFSGHSVKLSATSLAVSSGQRSNSHGTLLLRQSINQSINHLF